MAAKTSARQNKNKRRKAARRKLSQRLDEQRWRGYGEVIPERRGKPRREDDQKRISRLKQSAWMKKVKEEPGKLNKRQPSDRRGQDRRKADQRLDERRKGGYGEVTPDRRLAPRRKLVRRNGHRRQFTRRKR